MTTGWKIHTGKISSNGTAQKHTMYGLSFNYMFQLHSKHTVLHDGAL